MFASLKNFIKLSHHSFITFHVKLFIAALFFLSGCNSLDRENPSSIFSETPASISNAQLIKTSSCRDLLTTLQAHKKKEMQSLINQEAYYLDVAPQIRQTLALQGSEQAVSFEADSSQKESFSSTNNQETGIDESDLVKTDGHYIYLINGNTLEIKKIPSFGEIVASSSTHLAGQPVSMLMSGDKLVIFSQMNPYYLEQHPEYLSEFQNPDLLRGKSLTILSEFDISNRDKPFLYKTSYVEGNFQTARLINGVVRMVSYANTHIPGIIYSPYSTAEINNTTLDLASSPIAAISPKESSKKIIAQNNNVIAQTTLKDWLPLRFEIEENKPLKIFPVSEASCKRYTLSRENHALGITSITSFDLNLSPTPHEQDHIISNQGTIYASEKVLIIAEPAQQNWWLWQNQKVKASTHIHRFDITDKEATYVGSGSILGSIYSSFAISEDKGDIRIAATTNQNTPWWAENPEKMANHIYILRLAQDKKLLEIIGQLNNIALNEKIYATRFDKNRAYVVTFRRIDPLWIIDLSDPRNPEILGELKVPGVSTYIQAIENHLLLTIGIDGDDNRLNWNTQISLFDISNPALPELLSKISYQDKNANSWSDAIDEHKAFQYWPDNNLLSIPFKQSVKSTDNTTRFAPFFKQTTVFEVTKVNISEKTLSPVGSISHKREGLKNEDPCRTYQGYALQRSIFMGNFLYTISSDGIFVNLSENLSAVTNLPLAPTPAPCEPLIVAY